MANDTTHHSDAHAEKPRADNFQKVGSNKRTIRIQDRWDRDESVRKCFRAGMTTPQIFRLAQTFKHPVKRRRLQQILKRLHLVRSTSPREHVNKTNELLVDVITKGFESGWQTFYWEKEYSWPRRSAKAVPARGDEGSNPLPSACDDEASASMVKRMITPCF